jgi:amino acid adenylation domain-containing protein
MSAQALLARLGERGLSLRLEGADLRLEGPRSAIDASLVAAIRESKTELIAHLALDRSQGDFALSAMQQSYLIGRQNHFVLGNVSSHVYREIVGSFDLERLERALDAVIRAQPALRTVFSEDGRQTELPAAAMEPYRIAVTDLRVCSPAEREAGRLALREAMSHQVLPAGRAPLIDVRATRLSEDQTVLHVGHDGLVMDGISSFLFFRAWHEAYVRSGHELAPVDLSFRAYVEELERQRATPAYERAKAYWAGRLATLPAAPQLPLARAPESIQRPVSVRRTVRLGADRWAQLKARARAQGLTPDAVLLTAYAEVLSLWGGGERFTLNVTLANRLPIHPDVARAIGNFTDTLLVPVETDATLGFGGRAGALQRTLREALDHRSYSGLEVMRERTRRDEGGPGATMPVTFNSTLGAQDATDGGAVEAFGRVDYAVSQTPQVWMNAFVFESGGSLTVEIDSVDTLFPPALVDDLVGALEQLVTRLADEDAAWSRRDHELVPEAQLRGRRAANSTRRAIPAGRVVDRFLNLAAQDPARSAIITSEREIDYGSLRAVALTVAEELRWRDVGRDELVAVVMRKGWEQIAGILGVLTAGAAYLPIDASLPPQRVAQILAGGGARQALVQDLAALPAGTGLQTLALGDDTLADARARAAAGTLPEPAAVLPPKTSQDDLAYVLFTSGSTGIPKGVMISQRSVVNLVDDTIARFDLGAPDRVFAVSSASFDLSVFDMFGTLSSGGALVVPDHERAFDPEHWLALASAAGVSVWNSVPAIVALLVDQAATTGAGLPPSLRLVLMSGDRIPVELPDRIRALKPDVRVVSLGGPTETTVWNICYPVGRVDPAWSGIPYGKPTANNRAYVLDAQLRECPDHVSGEIHAAGTGLARGYYADPARTAESFFEHAPLGERLYRTGDVGRYLPDGNIEILGRADSQIKLNGYRIEAGEIETVLGGCAGVDRSAVVLAGADPALVAFVVLEPAATEQGLEHRLREHLAARLPSYMVPHRFVALPALPLSANGKVDRRRLTELGNAVAVPEQPDLAVAHGELEVQLIELWSELLGQSGIGPHSEFYRLGGTSLGAVRLVSRIRKEFGVSISLAELPRVETPRAMAARLAGAAAAAGEVAR